jgi:hypothetical protein
MPRRRIPKLRIVERKLGREKAYGQCFSGMGLIEIDPRQDSKCYMDTLLHEMLHAFFPNASEEEVEKIAQRMTQELWKRHFRRIKP